MCAIRNAGKPPHAPQCQSLLTLRLCTCFLLDFRTSIPIPLPISKQCQVLLIIQVSTKPPFIQLKYCFPRNSLPDLCQKILFPNCISSFLKFIILATTCLLLFFFSLLDCSPYKGKDHVSFVLLAFVVTIVSEMLSISAQQWP